MKWAVTLFVESDDAAEVEDFAEELHDEMLCGHMRIVGHEVKEVS